MEIRFKTLDYQKDSVQAIVDCFKGQPRSEGHRYMIDQGAAKAKKATAQTNAYSNLSMYSCCHL